MGVVVIGFHQTRWQRVSTCSVCCADNTIRRQHAFSPPWLARHHRVISLPAESRLSCGACAAHKSDVESHILAQAQLVSRAASKQRRAASRQQQAYTPSTTSRHTLLYQAINTPSKSYSDLHNGLLRHLVSYTAPRASKHENGCLRILEHALMCSFTAGSSIWPWASLWCWGVLGSSFRLACECAQTPRLSAGVGLCC